MINKEKFKWIAVFTALILLFVGVISSLVIAIDNKTATPIQDNGESAMQTETTEASEEPMLLLTMEQPKLMSAFNATFTPEVEAKDDIVSTTDVYVSQTVTATILPLPL